MECIQGSPCEVPPHVAVPLAWSPGHADVVRATCLFRRGWRNPVTFGLLQRSRSSQAETEGDERERAQAGESKICTSCWRDPAPWAWQGGSFWGTALTPPHRITQGQPSRLGGAGRGFMDGTGEWPLGKVSLAAAHCLYLSALLQ